MHRSAARSIAAALRCVSPATLAMLVALLVAVVVVELGWRDASPGLGVEVPVPRMAAPLIERLRSAPLTGIDDPRAAAIASGVIFGRTEHVMAADQEAFLASGLWHLLAASGQNIALVAGCCILLARCLGAGRTTGAMLALIAIPLYVVVVGGGASIVRAGAMAELALVAWLAGRLPDVRHLLVVAAAAICWTWPGAHRGLGMQLSFACVAALVIGASSLTRMLRSTGVPIWLAGAVAATLLCSASTAPLLWIRTGSAPLTGIVANIVAVPLAAGILVLGLAGSLIAVALDGVAPAARGDVLLWPTGVLSELLVSLAHRAAALPAAQTTSPLLALGVPACALLAASPVARVRHGRRVLLASSVACVLLPLAAPLGRDAPGHAFFTGTRAAPRAGILRIGVLDIGQGDATVLATSSAAVLVDTGPPDGRVVDRIRALGIDQLDGIVLTHDSLDHRGGFEAAVAALHPRWVIVPRGAPGSWKRVEALAPRIVEMCAGGRFDVGDTRVDVLHPRCDGTIAPKTGDLHNDGAMVLLVRHGGVRALLPADAEAPVLLGLGLPRIELLRVSHHGSRDPALDTLLARAAPQVAAISVGAHNDYGHPNPGVLASLRAAHVATLRTDRDGTVAFDSDGANLRIVD